MKLEAALAAARLREKRPREGAEAAAALLATLSFSTAENIEKR